jgi:hypothetical protein
MARGAPARAWDPLHAIARPSRALAPPLTGLGARDHSFPIDGSSKRRAPTPRSAASCGPRAPARRSPPRRRRGSVGAASAPAQSIRVLEGDAEQIRRRPRSQANLRKCASGHRLARGRRRSGEFAWRGLRRGQSRLEQRRSAPLRRSDPAPRCRARRASRFGAAGAVDALRHLPRGRAELGLMWSR